MRADLARTPLVPDHPALARGVVTNHVQDPDTRQWTLDVQLDSNRLSRGVRPIFASDGVISGRRDRLPNLGAQVLVGFAESHRGMDKFVIGCFDDHPHGVDRDSALEDLDIHPSGLAQATSPDGTLTTRFPGGDELIAGPGAGYDFKVRNQLGKPVSPKYPLRALRILGNFARGGVVLGARLMNGLEVIADAARREIRLTVSLKDELRIKPGEVRVTTQAMVVGERDYMTANVARWPEVEATLQALKKELQQVKHRTVTEKAERIRLQAELDFVVGLLVHPLLVPMHLIPAVPLPFITPHGKDGALIATVGGVEVVEGAAKTLLAE